jgi:hypothetical protein
MAKALSPQRAELFRLREYGRKMRTLKRGAARAAKVAAYSVADKRRGGK